MTGTPTLGAPRRSPIQAGRLRLTLRAELTAEETACVLARAGAPLNINRAGAIDLLRETLKPDSHWEPNWEHNPGGGRPKSIDQWAAESDLAAEYRQLVHRLFGPLLEVGEPEGLVS